MILLRLSQSDCVNRTFLRVLFMIHFQTYLQASVFWQHFAALLEYWWQTFVENWCYFGNLWFWSRIWSTLSVLLFRFCCGLLLYSFFPKLVSRFPLYKHLIKQVVQQLFNMGCIGSDGESACGLSCWDLQLCEVSDESKPTKIFCNFVIN